MSITPWETPVIPRLQRHTMETLLRKGVRMDNRRLDQVRRIEIQPGYIERAEGSALVKLGSTVVLAGVKLDIATPFPDTPNEAVLIVNAEFMPIASPYIEPGPPDENAIELARVIDRALRELRAVPLEQLAIEPGKAVWRIYVDVYVLNHDGNVADAAMLAAMAALMATRMPALVKQDDSYRVDRSKYTGLLPISHSVVGVTVAKIGSWLLVDPNYDEEQIADVKLHVAVSDDGRIAGLQKSGPGMFSLQEVYTAVNLALSKAKEYLEALEKTLKPYREELEKQLTQAGGEEKEEAQQPPPPPPEEKAEESLENPVEEETGGEPEAGSSGEED